MGSCSLLSQRLAMNETTRNFLEAMQAYFTEAAPKPIEYRLYYDESGMPVEYTTEDLLGRYIIIDQATYSLRSHRVRVIDGKLIQQREHNRMVMRPNIEGQACDPYSVAVVVADDSVNKSYWKLS